jgi:FtsH-binding integral membrane protein
MEYNNGPPYYNNGPGGMAQPVLLTNEALFFQKIYTWMCGALLVTALVGYWLSKSTAWVNFIVFHHTAYLIGIIASVIGVVVLINYLMDKVSSLAIKGLFLLYAVVMGAFISTVLLVYPTPVITKAFVCASAIYAAMALYGVFTKKSLQAWGSFLFMGLVGLIIAMIVNLILGSSLMDFVICVVGVIIFAGLTAYDHQKLRVICAGGFENAEVESKAVTVGALNLYLDFINIFLFLLRLFGRGGD